MCSNSGQQTSSTLEKPSPVTTKHREATPEASEGGSYKGTQCAFWSIAVLCRKMLNRFSVAWFEGHTLVDSTLLSVCGLSPAQAKADSVKSTPLYASGS